MKQKERLDVYLTEHGHAETRSKAQALIMAGYLAASLAVKLNGPRASGQKLNDMAFGSYCKKIENPRTPFDWLSRDPEAVDRYIADPKCGFVCPVYGCDIGIEHRISVCIKKNGFILPYIDAVSANGVNILGCLYLHITR